MKNPFEKKDNSGLIVTAVIAAVATAAIAYLYMTEDGAEIRKAAKHKIKDQVKDLASEAAAKKTGISKKTIKKVANFIAK